MPCAINTRRSVASSCTPICFVTRWHINTWRTILAIWSGLAHYLGHESLNTTARYTKKTEGQLAVATDRLTY